MDRWQSALDKAIQEALNDGQLNDLPGAGKPLRLNEDPNVPSDMQMAYKIMKENDIAPDWIVEGKSLEKAESSLRQRLQQAVRTYRTALTDAERATPAKVAEHKANALARWQADQRTLRSTAEAYNKRVLSYNLKVPSGVKHRHVLQIDKEIERALNAGSI